MSQNCSWHTVQDIDVPCKRRITNLNTLALALSQLEGVSLRRVRCHRGKGGELRRYKWHCQFARELVSQRLKKIGLLVTLWQFQKVGVCKGLSDFGNGTVDRLEELPVLEQVQHIFQTEVHLKNWAKQVKFQNVWKSCVFACYTELPPIGPAGTFWCNVGMDSFDEKELLCHRDAPWTSRSIDAPWSRNLFNTAI